MLGCADPRLSHVGGGYSRALSLASSSKLRPLARRLIMSAVADRQGGATATGVRHWLKFNMYGVGLSPLQHLDRDAPRWQKLEAESRLIDFVVWLVTCRPTGRRISADTGRKYAGQVVSWMRRVYSADFAGGMDLTNLRDVIKGMRREFGCRPKRVRYGVRPQQLKQALDQCLPQERCGLQQQTWRALLVVTLCGLLRGGEVGVTDADASFPTWGDVSFRRLSSGELIAVLMVRVLKDGKFTGKTTPVFLKGGGSLLDPVAELLALARLAGARRAAEPLFCDAHGRAISRSAIAAFVKALMAAIGEDPDRFGAHSLRIGGATAALAAGMHPSVIRIAGRWSSDVWELYARLTQESACDISRIVGSSSFVDVERGSFVSEELEMTPAELAVYGADLDGDGDADFSDDEGDVV